MYPKYTHAFIALTSFCALLLSGCGTYIKTDVERVQQLPATAEAKTFIVRSSLSDKTDSGSPYLTELVSRKLIAYGWQAATDGQSPDYIVTMSCDFDDKGVDGAFPDSFQRSFGGYSVLGPTGYPTVYRPFSGDGDPSPTIHVKYSSKLQLTLYIMHTATGMPPEILFVGSVRRQGDDWHDIASMIDALFSDFPRQSDKSEPN